MKTTHVLIAAAFLVAPLAAGADPWKDESGHRHRHHGEFKEEYWDGPCKVKREYKKGKYKEKRECERAHRGYYDDGGVVYGYGVPEIVIQPVIRIGVGRD